MSIFTRAHKAVLAGAAALATTLAFASPAYAWWETDYSYRTKINLNVDAAGITGEVARAPVLVRLHSGNFSFKDVKADGSDLRFVAGDDRTPLKFHIGLVTVLCRSPISLSYLSLKGEWADVAQI